MNTELHPAFVWDCDHCGRENFARAVEANLDEAAAQAIADSQIDVHYEAIGDEDSTESPSLITRIALAPARVTCSACGHVYEAELPAEG